MRKKHSQTKDLSHANQRNASLVKRQQGQVTAASDKQQKKPKSIYRFVKRLAVIPNIRALPNI
jgi:hypothetical protein